MNYLQVGARTLQARMESYAGISVTYRRPGKFSFSITAIPGRNPTELTDVNGTVVRGQIQDFTVDIAKLVGQMTDEPRRPIRNDEIVCNFGNRTFVFTVNAESFATSHYEPADSYGVAWRIHTKSDREI